MSTQSAVVSAPAPAAKPAKPRPISTTHNERYYHLTLPKTPKKPRATVFFRQTVARDSPEYQEDKDWSYSVAICARGDQFCKASGRRISRRRWFTGYDLPCDAPSYELAQQLAEIEASYKG